VVNEPDPEMLQESARMLEYESGGILVAILHSSKGQEIIMYRGKNYQRPSELRPRNLLNKRKAFQRSIEMQRRAVCTANGEIFLFSVNYNNTYGVLFPHEIGSIRMSDLLIHVWLTSCY
jgi:hypothetical protein